MSLAVVHSRAQVGIDAPSVTVEVHLASGLPNLSIVGLPEAAVKESKDRVRAALLNARFEFPARRITINLAPADLPKEGGRFDLPIALGILAASGQLTNKDLDKYEFVGELALTGKLRPILGALTVALKARANGRALLLPSANAAEAALAGDVAVYGAKHLLDVAAHLSGERLLTSQAPTMPESDDGQIPDLHDVRGQHHAKRALEIAAAGGHSLLFIGPPGAGKSLMAKALAGILPELTLAESVEITKIWSAAGILRGGLVKTRPFRAPHSSASGIAILGGGANPKPGEISLAHRGVLFLDELPEFHRDVLESLRQPLENGEVMVARAKQSLLFPAKFALVAAMNPCPCGYFGDPERVCRCSANEVFRYQKKISGPLLDRIDLQITVPRIDVLELREKKGGGSEGSAKIKEAVARAREIQRARFKKLGQPVYTNAEMSSKDCDQLITLDNESENFLKNALENTFISARGYYRVLKTARTIADLEGSEKVKKPHLAEAFGYRLRAKE